MTVATDTLRTLRAEQVARRDRIEAVLERQSRISDHIDTIALAVAQLPRVHLTVVQAARLRVIVDELQRRAGG